MTRAPLASGRQPRRGSRHDRRDVPHVMQRTLVLIRALATARRTAADLATIADMPLSASYRWLDYVVAAELPLEQDRSGGAATYWIDPADLAAFFGRGVEQPRSRR